MASSESLSVSWRFIDSSSGLRPTGGSKLTARASPLYSANLCQRAAFLTPVNRALANGCYFGARTSLRRFRRGSAFTSPRRRFSRGRITRLQSSLYATARWLARPAPTRAFTFELSSGSSPRPDVEYNYAGRQPIPAAGLAPVRFAALWAADGTYRKHGKHGMENPQPLPSIPCSSVCSVVCSSSSEGAAFEKLAVALPSFELAVLDDDMTS